MTTAQAGSAAGTVLQKELLAVPMIDVHRSLLPAFVGVDPRRQAYEPGVELIRATALSGTEDLDNPSDHRAGRHPCLQPRRRRGASALEYGHRVHRPLAHWRVARRGPWAVSRQAYGELLMGMLQRTVVVIGASSGICTACPRAYVRPATP